MSAKRLVKVISMSQLVISDICVNKEHPSRCRGHSLSPISS